MRPMTASRVSNLDAVVWARTKDDAMTRNADRKKAARSLAYPLECTYQQALAVLDGFPPDVRVEFPEGRATLVGRVIRCDLGPSIEPQDAWCQLCPWQVAIAPFKFALRAALAHDASCPGTPEHLELIGPRMWRRIPDAELDRRADRGLTRHPAHPIHRGVATGLATSADRDRQGG